MIPKQHSGMNPKGSGMKVNTDSSIQPNHPLRVRYVAAQAHELGEIAHRAIHADS
jgi:hypothetical protein